MTDRIAQSRPPTRTPGLGPGYGPSGDARAAYETHGVSLVRYLARRAAKTRLLLQLADLLPADGLMQPAAALAAFGLYSGAAAASFGRGYRQPSFDATGTEITERDPETGARITGRLDGRGPGNRLRLSVIVEIDGIGHVEGGEEIVGTTIGRHGLGMPAPSVYSFRTVAPLADWSATARGVVTAELAPTLRGTRVRAHGRLDLADDRGTRGTVTIARDGRVTATISGADPMVIERSLA